MTRWIDRRRCGFTMMEVLLLLSVSSVLMSLVAIWLHKVLLFSGTMLERERDHASLQRLTSELRLDVQLARSWSFTKPDELELVMPDNNRILYRLISATAGSQIEVIYPPVSRSETAISPPRQATRRQETYRFTPNCKLKWETAEFPEVVTLVVYRMPALAHPLPPAVLTTSDSGSPNAPAENGSARVGIDESMESRPTEAIVKLKINRWRGQVNRSQGDLP